MQVGALQPSGRDEAGDRPSFSVVWDVDTAVVDLVIRGEWNQRLGTEAFARFRKCLADSPSAIIIDLHELDDADGDSAPLWIAAGRAAAELDPSVQLVLSLVSAAALAGRLRRLGAERYLPIFETMTLAHAAITDRLVLTDRLQLRRLPPVLSSVAIGHGLAGVACDAWDLPDLLHPARLVLSELIGNAVIHAGTSMVVTVRRRDQALHLSVSDNDPRFPRPRQQPVPPPGPPAAERRHGLLIVETLSAAWGVVPTRAGKMVWATMRSHRHGRS
jgi:anti-sigma regulatory factor (Ser/Thr protein kinase)